MQVRQALFLTRMAAQSQVCIFSSCARRLTPQWTLDSAVSRISLTCSLSVPYQRRIRFCNQWAKGTTVGLEAVPLPYPC
jgi:hypothetical protein